MIDGTSIETDEQNVLLTSKSIFLADLKDLAHRHYAQYGIGHFRCLYCGKMKVLHVYVNTKILIVDLNETTIRPTLSQNQKLSFQIYFNGIGTVYRNSHHLYTQPKEAIFTYVNPHNFT